ncbi:MAG: hypothetical protein WEC34_03045 [Acidimicrobiia bacterium]
MLMHHLVISVAIVAVLLIVGVSFGVAFVIGMMAACGSMALMMFHVDRRAESARDDDR